MRILISLVVLSLGLSNMAMSQNLAGIFTNVDTLFMPGAAPGGLSPLTLEVTPIVSSSPCNIPLRHFVVATEYQNGRVIAIGHEGLLANNSINEYDNSQFLLQAMNWLDLGTKRVSLKAGWVNNGNSSILQNLLIGNGFTIAPLSGNITSSSLSNTDILLLGNDWNGTQPYLSSELSALDTFVANGGSVFIAGLGWSWPQALNLYPMNQAANLFGFEFTTSVINDQNHNLNGSPKFYNFYPDNLDTTLVPYCPSPYIGTNFARGDTLRVLRLAVSTNGEFTQQNGGASAIPLLLDNWLATINEIYGREYAVRFELIPNNDQLIFSNPATDPWATLPPGSGGCTNASMILDDQASVIDNLIGQANYDISHVIVGSPFGGGCAGGLKTGVSGGLDIPVTRHEMGHQFGQSHTIDFADNRNYEPQNGGWTIQGGNQQGFAHAVSFHQLANFLRNSIPNVGEKIPTNNTIPTVSAGLAYTIPIGTPFTLTASANDPDPADTLTYVWDNMNPGLPQSIPVADDQEGAIFMRLLPDTNSSRTFPRMSDVLANNNSNAQEQLPTQARIMDFRLTVNDNHHMLYEGQLIPASGSSSDDVQITVADAGPFVVTSQPTNGIIYPGGSNQLVSWEVNGTDSLPINTQQVTIMLSTDGGNTYPTVLLPSTANNGSAIVTLPNLSTTTARIQVAAVDNIYFDINRQNFEIQAIASSSDLELSSSTIAPFPNPATDFFTIDLPENLTYKLDLYTSHGQFIASTIHTNTFQVSHLSNGVYLLVITDLDSHLQSTKKVVIAR